MTILKQYFLKITTIVLLLLLCFPLSLQASSFSQPANEQVVDMNFEDNQNFYQKFTTALQSGEPLKVTTNFIRYSDIPSSLKEILALDNTDIPSLVSPAIFLSGIAAAAANFESGSSIDIKPHLTQPFVIVGMMAGGSIGAGFGSTAAGMGAIPGGFIGLGVGAFSGLVTASAIEHNYTFKLVIEGGRLTLLMYPT